MKINKQVLSQGISHFNLAVEQDRKACELNDPVHYQQALDHYNQAIQLHTTTFNTVNLSDNNKIVIESRINEMKKRKHVMQQWLEQYRVAKLSQQQNIKDINSNNFSNPSRIHSNLQQNIQTPFISSPSTQSPTPVASDSVLTNPPNIVVTNTQFQQQQQQQQQQQKPRIYSLPYLLQQPLPSPTNFSYQSLPSPVHVQNVSNPVTLPSLPQNPNVEPSKYIPISPNHMEQTPNQTYHTQGTPVYRSELHTLSPYTSQQPSLPSYSVTTSPYPITDLAIFPSTSKLVTPSSSVQQSALPSNETIHHNIKPENDPLKNSPQRQTSVSTTTNKVQSPVQTKLSSPQAHYKTYDTGDTTLYSDLNVTTPNISTEMSNMHINSKQHEQFMEQMNLICKLTQPTSSWDHIAGLDTAKQTFKETLIFPQLVPSLYGSIHRPWQSILVYGPSGVGKTSLVEAAASEAKWKLLTIQLRDLITLLSKNSYGVMKEIFSRAKRCENCIIHFKNIDVLYGENESNVSSQVQQCKQQFLTEIENIRNDNNIIIVTSTRLPWTLDEEIMSCMDRKVYISLPGTIARSKLLDLELGKHSHSLTLLEIEDIARECEGYSASDLKLLVKDARMETLRTIWNSRYFRRLKVKTDGSHKEKMIPCSKSEEGAIEMRYTDIQPEKLHAPPIGCLDFEIGMAGTKPSVKLETMKKHLDFTRNHGLD